MLFSVLARLDSVSALWTVFEQARDRERLFSETEHALVLVRRLLSSRPGDEWSLACAVEVDPG